MPAGRVEFVPGDICDTGLVDRLAGGPDVGGGSR